jgi:glycine betaine/proline transport system substrate-binding protein
VQPVLTGGTGLKTLLRDNLRIPEEEVSMSNTPITRRAFLAASLSAAALAACGRAPEAAKPAASVAGPTEAPKVPAANKPVIKLAENPWTGSSVNVYVAKALLESKLGYKVEIVSIDEKNQWPALAKGDLSASLELWPSGHADSVKTYITEQKVVEEAGKLGVVGKIGWFVPKYVVDAHPELATSDGYAKAENAALFKTAESGDAGQFLQGDPSWIYQDEALIKNLGLNFKIVKGGSEQAVLSQLDSAYTQKKPILFYLWTPHWAFSKYDLVNVKLPAYSEACYAKAAAGGVNCDYPEEILFKVVSAKLKTDAPDAHAFLTKFNYDNKSQIALIADVDNNKMSAAEAANKWIASNEAVWKNWLP